MSRYNKLNYEEKSQIYCFLAQQIRNMCGGLTSYLYSIINWLNPQCVMRQAHNLFENKFSTQGSIVLPLQIHSILPCA
jgi:hypothetical protein